MSKDGIVVTNYHVIASGDSAVVKFPDGNIFPVDGILAANKVRDLAVIKTHGRAFKVLTLGNSDQVEIGAEVVAIGNPLSLESTVSNGIVSGIRTDQEEGGKFLQVTAPISPGSSGGPLFNMAGEVVGITTMYLQGGENLNFAIPVNDAKRLLQTESSKLQNLPNEHESTPADASPSATGEGQFGQTNSPAYQTYQELLMSRDIALTGSTYACFSDDPQDKTFMIIRANFIPDKQHMMVLTQKFTSGVSDKSPAIFQGPLGPLSSDQGLFASLPSAYNFKDDPSHQTDVFEWAPDVLTMKVGFGKLLPRQVRFSEEFNMQRSTGRYTDEIVFDSGFEPNGFTNDTTGKCVRVPNTKAPEETYRSLR